MKNKQKDKQISKKRILIQRTSAYEAKELCEEALGHKIEDGDDFAILASAILSLEIANQKLGENRDFTNTLGIGEGLVKITQIKAPDEEHELLKEAILSGYDPENGFDKHLMARALKTINQRRSYCLNRK